MTTSKSLVSKQLTTGQSSLISVIAKYRFVTVPLLSALRHKNASTVYEQLQRLIHGGFVQQRYDTRWRLLGRPAVYSLTGKGLRAAQAIHPGHFSDAVIKNQYKNKSASLNLIDRSLAIAWLSTELIQHYPSFDLFTKAELDRLDIFLRPISDLYLRANRTDEEGEAIHYLIEIIDAGTLSWVIRRRINAHDDNEWDEGIYPTLLLVCDNVSTEKRIHRFTDEAALDITVWTTTRARLAASDQNTWLIYNDDEPKYTSSLLPEKST